MKFQAISAFPSPCEMPNGLQWSNGSLFVIDQKTDDVLELNEDGKVIRTISTPTENGSGVTVGGGFLWTASNGRTKERTYRDTDTHLGYIYKLDLKTGEAVERFRTPDGGGIHGIEWWGDQKLIWVTGFNPLAITLVEPEEFKVVRTFEVTTERLHGIAQEGEGIWCAHTSDNIIIKYDVNTGDEVERIEMEEGAPFVHGLSIKDGTLWYADANAGPPESTRGKPDIGFIKQV